MALKPGQKNYQAPICTQPHPRTDEAIARIAETLDSSAMTQFEISFSLYEPEKRQITQAFAYTNLLATCINTSTPAPTEQRFDLRQEGRT